MNSSNAILVTALTGSVCGTCSAAMTGICASVRHVSGYTLVDLYATMESEGNMLRQFELISMTTDAPGGFVQGSAPSVRGWAPDAGFTSTLDALDSFVTIGGSDYGDPSGTFYANNALIPAGWQPGSWTGTPNSAPSSQYVNDYQSGWLAPSLDRSATARSLGGLEGRMNLFGSSSASAWGVWLAHFVIAGDSSATISLRNWRAYYSDSLGSAYRVYQTPDFTPNLAFVVPAPGAVAALAIAGLARSRRRKAFAAR